MKKTQGYKCSGFKLKKIKKKKRSGFVSISLEYQIFVNVWVGPKKDR